MGFVTIATDTCTLVCRVRQYVISATAVSGDDVGMMTRVSVNTS